MRILNKTNPRNHPWGIPLITSCQPVIWPAGAQRGWGISIQRDIQNSTCHGPEQHDLSSKGPCFGHGVGPETLRGPFWPKGPYASISLYRRNCQLLPRSSYNHPNVNLNLSLTSSYANNLLWSPLPQRFYNSPVKTDYSRK